jgi:hypothetical protein
MLGMEMVGRVRLKLGLANRPDRSGSCTLGLEASALITPVAALVKACGGRVTVRATAQQDDHKTAVQE